MIIYTYDPWLVVLSIVIAQMSAFTGLSLTRGLSLQSIGQRKARIAMAATALGGGIWSMHFVAILAMNFDVPVYYDVIETVASALIAILLAGVALLILHFGRRTTGAIALSGSILGTGIVVMHYVGLSAIEGCLPVYEPQGIVIAGGLAIGMGIAAIGIAYGRRTERNTLLATVVFGAAVAVVHFSAMSMTGFKAIAGLDPVTPMLATTQIAVIVLVAAFVISGAFLLSGADLMNRFSARDAASDVASEPAPDPMPQPRRQRDDIARRLPYERDGMTHFVSPDQIAAIKAEGHYTTLWLDQGAVFCPWSITEAAARVPDTFMRVHRSWLVNLAHVSAYERARDHGYCLFAKPAGLTRVPVARTRIAPLRDALGL
jgi:diguanylate cyclase